jgi:enolase
LKALAKEQKRQVWQLINPQAKKFPRLIGNCIGGGKHSQTEKKPDFQEFLLIPEVKSVEDAFDLNKKMKKETEMLLKKRDENFKAKKTDENAWMTSLNEKEVLEVLKSLEIPLGIDIAASSFYKRKKYQYENPQLKRTAEEQFSYLDNLIKNFDIFYIEDPFDEENFENFAMLLKKFPNRLIVGDDLTVTSYKRLKKAIEMKSINAIIVKPNQNGCLTEVKRVCELAKKNNIKIVFSHRSGETEENILADLAFGFQADFLKCGIDGSEREAKLRRLIEIEKSLSQ